MSRKFLRPTNDEFLRIVIKVSFIKWRRVH
jgi:hypothetical protein